MAASGEDGEEVKEDYCSDVFFRVGKQYFYVTDVIEVLCVKTLTMNFGG